MLATSKQTGVVVCRQKKRGAPSFCHPQPALTHYAHINETAPATENRGKFLTRMLTTPPYPLKQKKGRTTPRALITELMSVSESYLVDAPLCIMSGTTGDLFAWNRWGAVAALRQVHSDIRIPVDYSSDLVV